MQSIAEACEQIGSFPFAVRIGDSNPITGSLPTEIGNLGSLGFLYSPSCCPFSAFVHCWILSLIWGWEQAACKDAAMQSMSEVGDWISLPPFAGRLVAGNQITGSLPTEIGNLSSIEMLYSPSCCPFSASVHC